MSAGGEVSWHSTLVGNATLSSCESEYVALSMVAEEASYLHQLQMQMVEKGAVDRSIRILAAI